MIKLSELRKIMANLETVGDPDKRIKAIYRHGAIDGARDALEQAKHWCPSCFETAPSLRKLSIKTADSVLKRMKP